MYKPMTERGIAAVMGAAVFNPDALQSMTPGTFCSVFGVPSDEQWKDMGGLIVFDARARVCARGAKPVPSPRSTPSGYRPLAFTRLDKR